MLEATITIDTSRTLGPVSPMIYGHCIEQLDRCTTGGISPEMPRSRRFTGFDDDHNGIADPWRKPGKDSQTLAEAPGPDAPGWLTLRCLRSTPEPHRIEHPGLTVLVPRTRSRRALVGHRQ
ncbi:MAG TPA: hypothetical protein DEP45_00260 [Armatimonadetes bacterium]|nr:hypothetical protein [Armatimonadota bacterium]